VAKSGEFRFRRTHVPALDATQSIAPDACPQAEHGTRNTRALTFDPKVISAHVSNSSYRDLALQAKANANWLRSSIAKRHKEHELHL
jgi:hypothetical protein